MNMAELQLYLKVIAKKKGSGSDRIVCKCGPKA